MRYILRVIKYFVQVSLTLTVILLLLMAFGMIGTDINVIFQQGWTSVGWIALMFLCVSAVYPSLMYKPRMVNVNGEYCEHRDKIVNFMKNMGYVLESEEGTVLKFRQASFVKKLFKLWEDRVVISHTLGGFLLEGHSRDLAKIVFPLERELNK